MDVQPGDTLRMREPHPCGSKEFVVLCAGIDFEIRCKDYGYGVMAPCLKCGKNIKKILREGTQDTSWLPC